MATTVTHSGTLSDVVTSGLSGNYYIQLSSNGGTGTAELRFPFSGNDRGAYNTVTSILATGKTHTRDTDGAAGSKWYAVGIDYTIRLGYWDYNNHFHAFMNQSLTDVAEASYRNQWSGDEKSFTLSSDGYSNINSYVVRPSPTDIHYIGVRIIMEGYLNNTQKTLRGYINSFSITIIRDSKASVYFLNNVPHILISSTFDSDFELSTLNFDSLDNLNEKENTIFNGTWIRSIGGTYTTQTLPLAGERDCYFTALYDNLYTVIYQDGSITLYTDTYGAREGLNYTLKPDSTIQSNGMQSLYKDKQFLGWSTESTATTATYTSGDTISNVIADITLYAIWQKRDSITIVLILPDSQNSQIIDLAIITVTGTAASDNNTYYFNPSSNISFSIAIKQEDKAYFIDSITANINTDLIEEGTLNINHKNYTSGLIITGHNGTEIIITINYIKSLLNFYQNNENTSSPIIRLYWGNNRSIGMYYENIKIL